MHLKIALLNPLYNFMVTTNKTNVFWWTPKLDKSKVREQKLKKALWPFLWMWFNCLKARVTFYH